MKHVLDRWSDEQERSIWSQAIFVFDSSTLLNFYEFSENTRSNIYQQIFPILKDRLWITNQTEYEFLKNRQKVLNRPDELYEELKQKHYPSLHFKVFKQQYDQLKMRTSKDTRHPYISADIFREFDRLINQFTTGMEALETRLNKDIEERKKENAKLATEDMLLSFFHVTNGFTFFELLELVKEGEFRYRQKIPPGYEDERDKDKFGIAKFGDLVIWKQMIKLANELRKPVLLVIDDLKEDWCYTDKADKSKMLAPREELIKEMKDVGGVSFWSYSSSQFLYKAGKILGSAIKPEVIEEAQEVVRVQQDEELANIILKWAQSQFHSDETMKSNNFWNKDTGVDIIQTLDGVPFGIVFKRFTWNTQLSFVHKWLEQIQKPNKKFTFEIITLVIVAEDEKLARTLILPKLFNHENIKVVCGYVNDAKDFVMIT